MGVLNAVLPIALLLVMGALLKHFWIKSEDFWAYTEKLIYYILFPALMITDISSSDFGAIGAARFIPALIAIVLLVMFVVWLLRFVFQDKAFFVSFIQGCVRYNSYVFIGITLFYVGKPMMPVIAVITAFMIMTTNIVSVILLNAYSTQKKKVTDVFLHTLKNPLILSCLAGLLMNVLHLRLPALLHAFLNQLGEGSVALGLLAVGAALHFEKDRKRIVGIGACSLVKLMLLPYLVMLALTALHVPKEVLITCVIYAGSPCATSAYVMSKNMGGDYKSMGLIISIQTFLCLPTLTFWLAMLPFRDRLG